MRDDSQLTLHNGGIYSQKQNIYSKSLIFLIENQVLAMVSSHYQLQGIFRAFIS